MDLTFSFLKKVMAGMLLLGSMGLNAIAQAPQLIPVDAANNQYPITFTDPDQKVIEIEFDQEIINRGNTSGWTITVGGTPVTFIGPVFEPADRKIIKFQLSSTISFADRNSVVVVYDKAASTASPKLRGTGGEVSSFGPVNAVNNLPMECEMFDLSRFDYSQTLTEVCSPVNVIYTVSYYVQDHYINSINYDPARITIRTFWNDGSERDEQYGAEVSPGVFRHTFNHTFPNDPDVCFWETYILPGIGGVGYCGSNGLRKTFTYMNHSEDNEGDGEFEMNADTIFVCLGQDFTELFTDATYFNCNPQTEPNFANDGPRHVRFTYGTNTAPGDRIQNIFIDGAPLAGTLQGPVIQYDSIQINGVPAPSGWATTSTISHFADLETDAVGQIFEVTLENWGPCNPYDDFESNAPIITRSYIKIIDAPTANAGPDDTIFRNEIVDLNGVIERTATSGYWTTSTGDGTFTNADSPGGATYQHGPNDFLNGGVWLTLHADDAGMCPEHKDSMYLTINPIPDSALPVSDDTKCEGDVANVTVSSIEAEVEYFLRREPGDIVVSGPLSGPNGSNITFSFTPGPATTATYHVLARSSITGYEQILSDKSIVTVNALPSVTTPPQDRTICEAGNTTFTIAASGPGLTYQWQVNDGGGWVDLIDDAVYNDVNTSTLSVSNVVPAMDGYLYRVSLTTTGSCEIFSNAGTLTVNPLPIDKNAVAVDPFLCYNTGTVIRIQSAQDGASYTIDNGVNAPQTRMQSGTGNLDFNVGPFSPASTTTYTYSITAEALGCTSTLTDAPQVTVNADIVLNAIAHSDICEDGQIDLPSAPVSGGSAGAAGFEYAWTGTDITGSITDQDPAPFNPALSGTHNINLQVTDANFRDVVSSDNTTCSVSGSLSFEVNTLPLDKTVIAQTSPLCYNSSTNIVIQSSEIGVDYTVYRKSDDSVLGTVSGNGGNASIGTGNLTSDMQYYVVAENITTNCIFRLTNEPTVIINPRFELAQPESSRSICVNSSTTFSVAMTGGTSPYTLVYSDGTNNYTENNYVSGQAISTGNLLASTTYNVVSVTDAAGCTVESLGTPITVTVGQIPTTAAFSGGTAICDGQNATLSVNISGGAPPFDITIDNGVGTYTTGDFLSDHVLSGLAVGTYTYNLVSVTDACGNSVPGAGISGNPQTVTVKGLPDASGTSNNAATICNNGTTNITLASTVPAATINWTVEDPDGAGAAAGSGTDGDVIAQDLTNTTDNTIHVIYHITPTGVAPTNCTGPTVDRTVQIEPTPKAVISNNSATICNNSNVDLNITSPTVPTVPGDLTFDLEVTSTDDTHLSGTAASNLSGQNFPLAINGTLVNSSDNVIEVTYTVTPKLNGCASGPDKTTTVVVEPTPKAQISNSTPVVCEGDNVNLNITSPTNPSLPGNLSFDLAVTSTNDGALGGGASLDVTNQTFPLNITGNLTNKSDSYITVTYTVTPKLNGCANGPAATTTVIVEPTPKATIANPTPNICNAEDINLAITSPTVSSSAGDLLFDLVVTSTNDAALSGTASTDISNQAFPYNINGSLINSSDEEITVTFRITPKINGCGTGAPVSTTLVVVEPTSQGSITNTTPAICNEENVDLTINSLTIPSNPADMTFDLVVTSTDDPNLSGTASGNLNYLSAGTVINGTLINSSYNNIVVTYSITPKLNGCSAGAPVTSNVTVYPTPDITATNNTPVLPTGSQTDIVLNGNVAGTTFGWRVLNPGTTGASDGGGLIAGESITQTLTNNSAVPISITYRIAPSANGCTGDSTDVTVQVDPNIEVSVTNNAPDICTGSNTDILIQSQVLGTTFDWTVNDPDMAGAAGGSGGPNTHTIQQNLVNAGTIPVTVEYTITPTGPAPTFIVGSPKTIVVTVYPKPDGIYTNRTPRICNGSSANILLDSNVPGSTFTWTVTDPSGVTGATASGTSLAIGDSIYQTLNNPGTTPVTVTYHIRPTGVNPTECQGDVSDIDVIVDPTPISNISNIAPVICSGTETDIQLNASVINTSFTWTVADPKGTGATGGSGNIGDHIQQTLTNATQTPITVTYEITPYGPGAAACPGAAEYIDVTVNPLPVTTEITGADKSCVNTSNLFYSVDLTPGSAYDWTIPDSLGTVIFGGDGLNSNAVIINTAASGAVGSIRVLETNQYGCVGTEKVKELIVSDQTPPRNVIGPDEVCDKATGITYSIPETAGSSYQWFIPAGGAIVTDPTIDSIDVNFGSVSGNVRVIETNSAGCITNHDPLFVNINPLPASTLNVNKTNICLGETVTFTAGPAAQANYEFFVDGVSEQDGPSNIFATDAITNGQQVYVNVTTPSGCEKTSNSFNMNVYDNPVVTLTSSDADNIICDGEFVSFTANAANAVSYEFFLNSTSKQYSALTLFSTNTLTDQDTVYAVATTMFGCTGMSNEIVTTVNPVPAAEISGDNIICPGDSTAFQVNVTRGTGPYSLRISGGMGVISNYNSNDPVYVKPLTNTVYTIEEIIDANGCAVNSPDTALTGYASINLNQEVFLSQQPQNAMVCEGIDTSFTISGGGTGMNIQWQVYDGTSWTDATGPSYSGENTPSLIVSGVTSAMNNYRYRAYLEGTCSPALYSDSADLFVRENPEITSDPVDTAVCEGMNAVFTVDAQGAGLTYIWQESTGGPFYDLQDTGSYTGTSRASLSFFNIPKTYDGNRYRVLITGSCSPAVSSSEVELTVRTSPAITTQPVDSTICQDNDARFEITAEGTGLSYQWQMSTGGPFSVILDDTTFSGTDTPALTVSDAEMIMNGYKFRVRVTGSCVPPMVSDDAILTVDANPRITIDPENAEICENGSAGFTGGAMGKEMSYQWQVFDGTSWTNVTDDDNYSGSTTSTLTLLDAPVSFNGYRYRMMVTGNCITIYTREANLTVNANPTSNITGDGTFPLVCGGFDLNLDGNPAGGSGTYTNHSWTGDVIPLSTYNTGQTVFNSYVNGSYNLTYTVTDSKGCESSSSAIIENDMPAADFNSDALPSCGYRMVNFTNTSSRAVSYEWHFDDGSAVETNADAAHGFDNNDPSGLVRYFDVKLVAQSANGCRDTANRIITIYPKVDPEFTIDPDTACHPFVATFLTQPGASSYTWDFGDGRQENSGYSVLHEFQNTSTEIETYTVTLNTISFYGCVASSSKDVVVYPKPSPGFSVSPIVQTYPDATVEVSNLVTPGPWTYSYDFGDGTVVSEENPTHTYTESGSYQVIQTVSSGSCADSISQTVIISPTAPTASFEVPDPACTPMRIQFHNTSEFANAYLWEFDDGSISTKKDPVYTYFEPGIYKVSLTVSGPGGSDKFTADIEVWESPSAFFSNAPDSVFVNDKPVKFFNYSSGATGYFWDFGDTDETTGQIMNQNRSTEYDPHHIYESIGWKDVMMVAYNSNCRDTLYKENAVYVSPSGSLRFPNVFKPNPNGPTGGYFDPNNPGTINQIFSPGVIDKVLEYHLYIYNRWGELVFSSDEVNKGWDGYINGQLARQGVYIWKVKGKYTNGKNYLEVGDVTLLH